MKLFLITYEEQTLIILAKARETALQKFASHFHWITDHNDRELILTYKVDEDLLLISTMDACSIPSSHGMAEMKEFLLTDNNIGVIAVIDAIEMISEQDEEDLLKESAALATIHAGLINEVNPIGTTMVLDDESDVWSV